MCVNVQLGKSLLCVCAVSNYFQGSEFPLTFAFESIPHVGKITEVTSLLFHNRTKLMASLKDCYFGFDVNNDKIARYAHTYIHLICENV